MYKLKPGMHRELSDLWKYGMTADFISKAYGVCRQTLRRWLSEIGAPKRHGGAPVILNDEMLDIARKMRAEGIPWDRVSARMGFDKRHLQMRVAGHTRRATARRQAPARAPTER